MKSIQTKAAVVLAVFLAGAAAWAAPTAAWERGMAENRRPEMPSRKTRSKWLASRTMQERTPNAVRWASAGVANGALEASGTSLPAGAEWETAFASEEERIEVAAFRDGAGRANRMAVYEQLGNQVPFYWIVEGNGAASGALAVARTAGARWEVEGVLSRSEVEMAELGEEVVPPYERFRFCFLDDAPETDWIRPCRYLFEDADGNGFTVLWKKMSPRMRNRATGTEIPWAGTSVEDVLPETSATMAGRAMEQARAVLPEDDASGWAEENTGGGKNYFVLFSGGGDIRGNDVHFWCNVAMLYSTLTKTYRVPKKRISVFVSDGLSTNVDANLAGGLTNAAGVRLLVPVDSPRDLDGDGVPDVNGPATPDSLSRCLEGLSKTLKPEDRLWIYITSHGGYLGITAGPDLMDSYFCSWSDGFTNGDIKDTAFAKWTAGIRCPVAVVVQACYSGGFLDEMTNQANRAIATAAHHYEPAIGGFALGYWSDGVKGLWRGTPGKTTAASCWSSEFISALRGVKPANLGFREFPWEDGYENVDADANRDGRVSFFEAAEWAARHDETACPRCKPGGTCRYESHEHPQYGESRGGVGNGFFIPKQSTSNAPDPDSGEAGSRAAARPENGTGEDDGIEKNPPGGTRKKAPVLPIPKSAYKTDF